MKIDFLDVVRGVFSQLTSPRCGRKGMTKMNNEAGRYRESLRGAAYVVPEHSAVLVGGRWLPSVSYCVQQYTEWSHDDLGPHCDQSFHALIAVHETMEAAEQHAAAINSAEERA